MEDRGEAGEGGGRGGASVWAALVVVLALVLTGCGGSSDRDDVLADGTSGATGPMGDGGADEGASGAVGPDRTETGDEPTGGMPRSASVGCGRPQLDLPENRVLEATVDSSGGLREYLVYVPESYRPDRPSALVVTFHGRGYTKEDQLAYSAFGPLAQEDGSLVVSPDALGNPSRWSPYGHSDDADAGERNRRQRGALEGVSDIEFFDDLLDELAETFCVDLGRVLVTGMSSGGFMATNLACARSDRVTMAAPVAATMWADGPCGSAGPVAFVYFHGTDDPIVSFEGPVPHDDGSPGPGSAETYGARWAEHNGCDPEPGERDVGADVRHRWWDGCDAPTHLYIVDGGGHTWPGGLVDLPQLGHTTREVSASEIIWGHFGEVTGR